MDWVKEGHIGKVTLSRGLNYKKRESIGKVAAPVVAKDDVIKGMFRDTGGKPQDVDVEFKLWSGPRGGQPSCSASSSTTTGTGSGLSAMATSATRGRISLTWAVGPSAIKLLVYTSGRLTPLPMICLWLLTEDSRSFLSDLTPTGYVTCLPLVWTNVTGLVNCHNSPH